MAADLVPEPSVDDLIAAAAARLRDEADQYGDRVATQVNAEIDGFPFPAAVTPQTRAAVRSTLEAFVEMVSSPGNHPVPQLPPAAASYARTFVRRRVPIVVLLRTYLLGYRELWRYWVAAVRAAAPSAGAELQALDASAEIFFAFVDGLTAAIVEIFETELAKWSRSMNAIRTELIEAILDSRPVDITDAERTLVYRLGESHLGLVLWSSEDSFESQDDRLEQTWQALVGDAGAGQSLVLYAGQRVFWGWFGGTADRLEALVDALDDWEVPQPGIGVAIGEPGRGLPGFRDSHRQALHVRRVASIAGRPAVRAIRFRRLAVPALASIDPSLSVSFVRRQLGPLAEDTDVAARLRGTMETFFDERENAAATGRRLGIHPNTVTYRLRQAEELLGYPPDQQRLELHLALRLIRYVDMAGPT